MGIDIHALYFIEKIRSKHKLGNIVTVGRQGFYCDASTIQKRYKLSSGYKLPKFVDNFFIEHLGAHSVDSIDNSNFENATIVHDMNTPIKDQYHAKYDTVIDGGSLEHIFQISQALENCSLLCKPGGRILHMLPANNFCGHGFWQISPELFFSIYTSENGYEDTEVFISKEKDREHWFQVLPPSNGHRAVIYSSEPLVLLVATKLKIDGGFSHKNIQQSDYSYLWSKKNSSNLGTETASLYQLAFDLCKKSILRPLISPIYHWAKHCSNLFHSQCNDRNPSLKKISIQSMIKDSI